MLFDYIGNTVDTVQQQHLNQYRCNLDAQPGLGIQPCYKAPGGLQDELVENTVNNIGLVRLYPREWPKVGRGTAK